MQDLYRILNVGRDADAAAIKAAYRKLAKQLHPDRNPGDSQAERRFKELSRAYDILSDPDKRAQYDAGAIDSEGNPRGGFGFGGFGRGASERPFGSGFETIFERAFGGGLGGFRRNSGFGNADVNAAFEDMLRSRTRRARPDETRRRSRGLNTRHHLEVDFLMAARGGKQRLRLSNGRTLEVDVPPGTRDGQVLRLKGQGGRAPENGEPGDALIEIAIRPHPHFERKGQDIHLDLPITLPEAVLGAKVKVPTIDGPVRINVPPGSNSGHTLRLRGRGLARSAGERGDQYVRLVIMLPASPDPELADYLERWARERDYDVRGDLEPA
jgi:DnaJ-class molecular chaperone